MQEFLLELESTDAASLTLLAVALTIVGNAISGQHSEARQWGAKAGIGAFLLWTGYWLMQYGISDPMSLFGGLIRGLIFGVIAAGAVNTAAPILRWLHRVVVEEPEARSKRKANARRSERDQQEYRRRNELQQEEVRRREAIKRQQKSEAEAEKAREQSLRHDARFEVRAFYDAHPEIAHKLPLARFERYLNEDLSDQHPAAKVQERAEKLIAMMHDMVTQHERGDRRFGSLVEIRQHFRDELQRVSESDFDNDLKQTLLADLARDEERAMREFRQQ